MRPIKFRAWDKRNKEWVDFNDIDWFPVINFEGKVLRVSRRGDWSDIDNWNVDLIQYTGLKDNNGKEIYEGDIVHITNREWQEVWSVKYDEYDAKFVVYNQLNSEREFSCINPKTQSGEGTLWVMVTEEEYWQPEVIGNIWENPELLRI